MRISSGLYKGHHLEVPKKGVTPTSEMLRQAVMSIIRPHLPGARIMDICAGTGAVGIEALSNGGEFCLFIEHNPGVYRFLHQNLDDILEDKSQFRCFQHNAAELNPELIEQEPGTYDIIFSDPFYKDAPTLFPRIFTFSQTMLRRGGLFIFEHGQEIDFDPYPGLSRTKKYGDSHLSLFQKEDES